MCDPDLMSTRGSTRGDSAVTGVKEIPGQQVLQSSLGVRDRSFRGEKTQVLLQTAQAWAEGLQRRTLVRLLLDGGSQRTFIQRGVSEKLQLKVLGEEELRIFTFGDNTAAKHTKCRRVELWLRSQYDRQEVRVEALEVPCICADIMTAPSESSVAHMMNEGMNIADASRGAHTEDGISLLIGADYYWAIVTGSVKRLSPTLMAVDTTFGWTLQGQAGTTRSTAICSSAANVMRVIVTNETDKDISAQLRSFWELEHLGIKDTQATTCQQDAVLQHHKETTKYEDGRYQVALPWKPAAEKLTDNLESATRRLRSQTNRLQKNEQLIKEYDACIRDYVAKGYAEPVEESNPPKGPVYYMPHQAVVRHESQTTKMRVVFDASSSLAGRLSLNDVLESGPNLNPELIDLLLRFRTHNIAAVADIEKAFLQVSLTKED